MYTSICILQVESENICGLMEAIDISRRIGENSALGVSCNGKERAVYIENTCL